MKYAADFRQEARAALQGKWPLAILVGLVAAILGGATSGGPEFKINFTGGSLNANIQYAGQTIYSWGDGITPGLRAVLVDGTIYQLLEKVTVLSRECVRVTLRDGLEIEQAVEQPKRRKFA